MRDTYHEQQPLSRRGRETGTENSRQADGQDRSVPLVSLENVTKRYARKGAPALGPLSLQVYPGQVLGIRGPNGAGKSTLMGLLAGSLQPDSGRVVYGPDVKGRIGFVPQDLSLYSELTCSENVKFWGIAGGLPAGAIPRRTEWLLKELDLEGLGDRKVSTLSGGMKRRLHLASALMVTPSLLLLDEPTVGADASSIRLILQLLQHFASRGCGVVLISHLEGELETACTKIIRLEKGQMTGEDR